MTDIAAIPSEQDIAAAQRGRQETQQRQRHHGPGREYHPALTPCWRRPEGNRAAGHRSVSWKR